MTDARIEAWMRVFQALQVADPDFGVVEGNPHPTGMEMALASIERLADQAWKYRDLSE